MRKGDAQIGLPAPVYTDTAANIEALSGVVEGATAYATDTDEPGWYDGAAWTWGAGGSGGGDSTYTAAYASRPAASNDGDLFLPSDGVSIERDTGATWVPWGPLFPFVKPVLGDFTWFNQGGATVTDVGGLSLYAPATSGDSFRILKKAAPATPYVITTCFMLTSPLADYIKVGLVWRQSSDGKLVSMAIPNGGSYQIAVNKYNSETAYSGNYINVSSIQATLVWFRIADDNTNRICSYSYDGINFITIHTVGRTDFITADEVGFAVSTTAAYLASMVLLSWKEE